MLESATARDQEAWCRLVDRYGGLIYGWARQHGLQEADATDVTQEVLRAVARKLPDFEHDKKLGRFRGWLYRITTNKLADFGRQQASQLDQASGGTDHYRRLMKLVSHEITETGSTPAISREIDRFRQIIDQVRGACKEKTWRLFWRVDVDGNLPEQVAEEFGVSSNTVYLAVSRTRKRLRDATEKLDV